MEPLYTITHGNMFPSCKELDEVQGVTKSADCDEANLFGDSRDAARRRFDAMDFSPFDRLVDDTMLVPCRRLCNAM